MDTSSVSLLDFGLQYQWCSDSDFSCISSPETLSPVHSMDSSLSPSYQQTPQSTTMATRTGYCHKSSSSSSSVSESSQRKGRASRFRSKQRESASEKEKLRMRDLTKALHHLRSYLPPSVAPVGQTLTKIETLRLTIRYISYLSNQLGLSEDVLFQRREQGDPSTRDSSSPDIIRYFQNASVGGITQSQNPYPSQCYSQNTLLHSGDCNPGLDPLSSPYSEVPQGDMSMDRVLQSSPASQPSCQMHSEDFCIPLVPRDYWG